MRVYRPPGKGVLRVPFLFLFSGEVLIPFLPCHSFLYYCPVAASVLKVLGIELLLVESALLSSALGGVKCESLGLVWKWNGFGL